MHINIVYMAESLGPLTRGLHCITSEINTVSLNMLRKVSKGKEGKFVHVRDVHIIKAYRRIDGKVPPIYNRGTSWGPSIYPR